MNKHKETHIWLFPTRKEALQQLDTYYIRQEELATTKANIAQENLFLVAEYIKDYYDA